MGELFGLQDDIARRVVEALSLPLAGGMPTPDAPHNARAYELYLRANELARTYNGLVQARDCTSGASIWIRASLPPGRSSVAATA